jgi:hypothetical protein
MIGHDIRYRNSLAVTEEVIVFIAFHQENISILFAGFP